MIALEKKNSQEDRKSKKVSFKYDSKKKPPKYPERWLPKFNPDDGLPAEEHIHNFILAINLK